MLRCSRTIASRSCSWRISASFCRLQDVQDRGQGVNGGLGDCDVLEGVVWKSLVEGYVNRTYGEVDGDGDLLLGGCLLALL